MYSHRCPSSFLQKKHDEVIPERGWRWKMQEYLSFLFLTWKLRKQRRHGNALNTNTHREAYGTFKATGKFCSWSHRSLTTMKYTGWKGLTQAEHLSTISIHDHYDSQRQSKLQLWAVCIHDTYFLILVILTVCCSYILRASFMGLSIHVKLVYIFYNIMFIKPLMLTGKNILTGWFVHEVDKKVLNST